MTVLERVPIDDIRERADEIRFGRLILTLVVGAFWAVGWAARKTFRGAAFLAAAVQVGWREAGPATTDPRPRR